MQSSATPNTTSSEAGGGVAARAPLRLPELLAPAGDWACAKAAVENGADAIYFGLDRFNARMRAHNFTEADLPRLMEFLHVRGVKGYVTFNTLVFENELVEAEQYLKSIITSGVDAAIVQDVGMCRLIRELSPDFPIHASTQMTITSASGVEFARELGCNMVVLARECSIREIDKIREALRACSIEVEMDFPLEVFVHGALCVAYSGQCLTSEALGGRSANRGECAQACRMPYELISDGSVVPLGDKRYLLSPQDLAGIEILPELVKAGVNSLKIEGRLKSPEYVASITRVYRNALDNLANPLPSRSSADSSYELQMAFSRGLYSGWFKGIDNQELVHARFGKKRGVYLGKVARVTNRGVVIDAQNAVKPGDGVVFDSGHPDQNEEGGRIFGTQPLDRELLLEFGREMVDLRRIHTGDRVWKTSDPELEHELRQTFAGEQPKFQRPLDITVHGALGRSLNVFVRDEEGHVAQVESEILLQTAQNQPLTEARLREQLGRLGNTPFKLGKFQVDMPGDLMLPVSELNRLRREVVSRIVELRRKPKRWRLQTRPAAGSRTAGPPPTSASSLVALVRTMEQFEVVLGLNLARVYCEFEDPKKYRLAVERSRELKGPSQIWVAPPRIFKMGEDWILKQVRSSEADGYLARNYDHLKFFASDRMIGDFSLNISNRFSAEYFMKRFGLERITASYDLNISQLEALLQGTPAEWFEITLHQHMPMFHMEHCVFCAFLSQGKDFRDCGRPCDKHEVRLRDRVGAEHPLKADVGCRNTVFNAQAQSGAEYYQKLRQLGVRQFRIEFVNETPAQVRNIIGRYQKLLGGELSGADVWRGLKVLHQLGVTRGQMENG